jgi:hypothetical protein
MAQISAIYGRKLKYIKSYLPKRNFYTMHEFFLVCPCSHESLKEANRLRQLMQWRQVGMVWATLSGFSLTESGKMFNKNHATVIHSQEMVKLALEGYHPELLEKLNEVLECIEITNAHANDYNTALIISARRIENMLKTKYKRINQMN